jgi:hypothetical protein
MKGKSHDPKKPGSGPAPKQPERPKPEIWASPPAGPHAEPHLTNPDATPGTGSFAKNDHGDVETDPGGG